MWIPYPDKHDRPARQHKTQAERAANWAGTRFNQITNIVNRVPQREQLLNRTQNPRLSNAINELYRPTATIGDGGTADMLRHEFQTGQTLTHLQKAQDYIRNLQNIINTQSLSQSDLTIANRLLADLQSVVNLVVP